MFAVITLLVASIFSWHLECSPLITYLGIESHNIVKFHIKSTITILMSRKAAIKRTRLSNVILYLVFKSVSYLRHLQLIALIEEDPTRKKLLYQGKWLVSRATGSLNPWQHIAVEMLNDGRGWLCYFFDLEERKEKLQVQLQNFYWNFLPSLGRSPAIRNSQPHCRFDL